MSINRLFGSRTRVKLLTLFFSGAKRPYYVREISRRVKERVNSVRRELDNLKKIGILQSVTKKGKKYYLINLKFPYYSELRSLVEKAMRAPEDQLFKNLGKTGQIKLAVLTGLFTQAKGTNIDFLVVGKVAPRKLQGFVKRIENKIDEEVNYTVMSENEYKYRKSIDDRFLNKIFSQEHIILIDRREKRKNNL